MRVSVRMITTILMSNPSNGSLHVCHQLALLVLVACSHTLTKVHQLIWRHQRIAFFQGSIRVECTNSTSPIMKYGNKLSSWIVWIIDFQCLRRSMKRRSRMSFSVLVRCDTRTERQPLWTPHHYHQHCAFWSAGDRKSTKETLMTFLFYSVTAIEKLVTV